LGVGSLSGESAVYREKKEDSQAKSGDETGITARQVTTIQDIAHLIGLAKEFHEESRFSHIPFSEEKYFKIYSKVLKQKNNIAFFINYKGRPVGIISAVVGDYFLGDGGRMVTTNIIYVSSSIRSSFLGSRVGVRLVRLISSWAKAQEVEELHIHTAAGIEPEHSDRFFKKLGFVPYGGNYVARVG